MAMSGQAKQLPPKLLQHIISVLLPLLSIHLSMMDIAMLVTPSVA